jgi:hypothetical protein
MRDKVGMIKGFVGKGTENRARAEEHKAVAAALMADKTKN